MPSLIAVWARPSHEVRKPHSPPSYARRRALATVSDRLQVVEGEPLRRRGALLTVNVVMTLVSSGRASLSQAEEAAAVGSGTTVLT